jgi:site-specific DNA recombinase
MKKAVAYVRVSTEKQKVKGVSMETQVEQIRAWCSRNGYAITAADIYDDAGISASSMKGRNALKQLLDDIEPGTAVIVYSLSRLTRSMKDATDLVERFTKKKVALVSLTEPVDTKTATGTLMFQQMVAYAQFERSITAERTKAALSQLRATSRVYCKIAPYGFMRKGNGKKLYPVAAEREVIEKMMRWRGEGKTIYAITRKLNEEGVPTRKGTPWLTTTVKGIVEREEGGE